jgi:hypothetical protein
MSNASRPRPWIFTVLFYVFATLVMGILSNTSPGGPCSPGLGVVSFLLLFITSIVLLVINAGTTLFGKKNNGTSVLMHFFAVIVLFILFL